MTRRRGNLEGSIYKRSSDGRWVGAIHIGHRDGRRVRRFVYGKTRREVREQLAALQAAAQRGLPIATDVQTLAGFLSGWLATIGGSVRPRTLESYGNMIRLHVLPTLGHERLVRLTPQQVQALLDGKLAEGLSPRTVQYLHAIVRRALNQAVRWGVLPRNVSALIEGPRVPRTEIQPMSPVQARALLDHVRGDRLEALYAVALGMGLRQGEALGLRWSDVDFDSGTVTVRHSLQRVGGKVHLVEPKTDRSRRAIAMPGRVTSALRDHRTRQLEERLWAGSRWVESDYVFTTSIGTPLDGANVTHRFQRTLEAAGLPRVSFHALRHTCASFLLAQGVSPRVVMETLGHSTISTTMNVYAHVMPAMQRDAADRMDALLTDSATA